MKILTSFDQLPVAYKVGFRYIKNVGARYVVVRKRRELHNGAVKIKDCLSAGQLRVSTIPLNSIVNY